MAFSSAYDTLSRWARKTSTVFGELRFAQSGYEETRTGDGRMVYRLKHWPELPSAHRTAAVYRALSLMSNRPVNRAWFVKHSRMKPQQVDRLIDSLLACGALEAVDISGYPAGR
jgi:hypothetical protein